MTSNGWWNPLLSIYIGVMVAWTGIEHFCVGRFDPPPPADDPEDVVVSWKVDCLWVVLIALSKGRLPVIVVLILSHICVISMIYGRDGHWERNLLKEEAKLGPWEKLEYIRLLHLSSKHLCSNNHLDMAPCIEPFVANSTSFNCLLFMADHCTLNQVFWLSMEIICCLHVGLLILMSSIKLGCGAIVRLVEFPLIA